MATRSTADQNRERMMQSGGDQFVAPYTIEADEAPYLRNIRTGEIHLYHETFARMGGQIFEPWHEAPEWLERRVRINEAKAAAALQETLAEQAREEEAYLKMQQRQDALVKTAEVRAEKATRTAKTEAPSFLSN